MGFFTRLLSILGLGAKPGHEPAPADPKLISPTGWREPIISLTEAAAAKVRELIEEQQLGPGAGLIVSVKHEGPTGYMYDLQLEKKVDVRGVVMSPSHGVPIAVAEDCVHLIEGTTIDYEESELAAGFRFHNPRAV